MGTESQKTLVLGNGSPARALAAILDSPLVLRTDSDTAWQWPKQSSELRAILVVETDTALSQLIRRHGEAWGSLHAGDFLCVIFGLSDEASSQLLKRNVFGRRETDEDSFEQWSDHIAVLPSKTPLAELLQALSSLSPCPIETWHRHAKRASVVPQLRRALSERDVDSLRVFASQAQQQDWDAICPHEVAGRIVKWLNAVTSDVTPDWDDGDSILASLAPTQ